jgi:hypothetical protein
VRAGLRTGALVVGAAAYAGFLATTEPFTLTADIATAVPLAAGAVVTVHSLRSPTERRPFEWRAALPWLVLLGAVVAWELITFFAVARATHPTLSSLYDTAARHEAAKAAVAFCWLLLGWELVR